MDKYTLALLGALTLSPLETVLAVQATESILPTEFIIDANASKAEQLQQVINILNYVREENKDVADKLEELSEQTDAAFEQGSLSKIIDIIIQALIYATSRIKHYDENFINYVRGNYDSTLDSSNTADNPNDDSLLA